jgi:hypothetical protein
MFGHLYGAYRCCGWHHIKRIIVLLIWNAQEQIRVVKGRDLAVVSVAKWSPKILWANVIEQRLLTSK